MKNIFSIVLVLFLAPAAQSTQSKATLPVDTMKNIEAFSKKNLNPKTDLEEVKSNLNTLLLLDDEDPSRTAVMMLSESYNKNKALYEKAFKAIENPKNKKQLKEIKSLMASFYKSGNG